MQYGLILFVETLLYIIGLKIQMKEIKFSAEQEIAISTIDRHISLTANAGSGKTAVLTSRIMYILKHYAEQNSADICKHIAAITFTRLATAQLREKIIEKIDLALKNELEAERPNELLVKNYSYMREHVSQLRIMTIHGFCNSVLQEYAQEAGLTPSFKVLEPINAQMLKERVFSALHTKICVRDSRLVPDSSFFDRVDNLVGAIGGISKFHDAVISILDNGINHEKEEKFYDNEDIYLKKMSDLHAEFMKNTDAEFREQLTVLRDAVSRAAADDDKIRMSYLRIDKFVADINNGTSCEFVAAQIDRDPKSVFGFLNADLTVGTRMQKKFDIKGTYIINSVAKKLRELIDKYKHAANDEDYVAYSRTLYEVGKLACRLYEKEKRSQDMDYIDNDDMLVITRNLLRDNASVRMSVQKDIRYLLIDEFQDTDDVQYDIIRYVISDLDPSDPENHLPYSNNLFVVGDPKQSIYSFRNADVKIFNSIKKDIVEANKRNPVCVYDNSISEEENESKNFGRLSLTATFRLKPFNIAYVNQVCEREFNRDKTNGGQEYLSLVYPLRSNDKTEELASIGNVDFLCSYKNKDDKDEATEATALCLYIRNQIDNCTNADGSKKTYSDFGILYRSRGTKVESLYLALTKYGIPYVERSGGGFYGRDEVRDLVYLIRFVFDNEDDFSFVSLLKSEYCGFTDTELFNVIYLTKELELSYYRKFKAVANDMQLKPEFSALQKKIRWCLSVLDNVIEMRGRLPVSILLYQFIRDIDWYVTLENDSQKERKIANTEKFMDIARAFFSSGFKSYHDFLQFIEYNQNDQKQESQAALSEVGNVVSMQTIHSAKGLEYKHVVLYGIKSDNTGGQTKVREFSFNENYGFYIPFCVKNPTTMTNDPASSSFMYSILEDEKANSHAELLRLFYVALTRGEEHLTFSTEFNPNAKTNPVFNTDLNSFFPLMWSNIPGDFDLNESDSFRFDGKLKVSGIDDCLQIQRDIPIIKELETPEQPVISKVEEITKSEPEEDPEKIPETLIPGKVSGWVSASKLMEYKTSKQKFDERNILGLPDDTFAGGSGTKPKVAANVVGSIVHSVFEHFNSWNIEGKHSANLLSRVIEEAMKMYVENLESDELKKLESEIEEIILPAVNSDFLTGYSKYLTDAAFEKELNFMIEGNFITTIFDVLTTKENGDYEILDWKTNRFDSAERYSKKVNEYSEQMKLYCFMVYKMRPQQNIFTAKLVFLRLFGSNPFGLEAVKEFSWTRAEMQQYEAGLSLQLDEILSYPFYGVRRNISDDEDDKTLVPGVIIFVYRAIQSVNDNGRSVLGAPASLSA